MSRSTRRPATRASALRTLSIVLAFAAALGLLFGTAGFSAMTADRGLAVNVTNDEVASLGYEPLTDTVQNGEPTPVVEYRNRFDGDLAGFGVDVSLLDPERTRTAIASTDTPDGLSNGERETVRVVLSCPVEEEVDLLFEASGSGAGVSVSLDRVHTVTCVPSGATVTGVQYAGIGNAHVKSERADSTVEAIVWLTDANPGAGTPGETLRSETIADLNTSIPVQSQLPSPLSDRHIVAVEFPDREVAFFHPGWAGQKHTDPGDGVRFTDGPLDAETVSNTSVVDDESDD